MQRGQHALRQHDLAPQRRVHRVLEQLVIQQAVAADSMKIRLSVDQYAVVPRGDIAVHLLKIAGAADRHAVEVSGRDVMPVGVVPVALRFQQPRQPIVRLGETRLPRQQPLDIARCSPPARSFQLQADKNSRRNLRALGREVAASRNDRLGSNPASLAGGTIKTGERTRRGSHRRRSRPSRRRKSASRAVYSAAVYTGTSIRSRVLLDEGGIATRHLAAVRRSTRTNGDHARAARPIRSTGVAGSSPK